MGSRTPLEIIHQRPPGKPPGASLFVRYQKRDVEGSPGNSARGPWRAREWASRRPGMGPRSNLAYPPRRGAVETSEWDAYPPLPLAGGPVALESRASGKVNPSELETSDPSPFMSVATPGLSRGSHTPPDSGWPGEVARVSLRIRPEGWTAEVLELLELELRTSCPRLVENPRPSGTPI